ncbi:unnamed protein product, partial [Didymodactylos carnosus]
NDWSTGRSGPVCICSPVTGDRPVPVMILLTGCISGTGKQPGQLVELLRRFKAKMMSTDETIVHLNHDIKLLNERCVDLHQTCDLQVGLMKTNKQLLDQLPISSQQQLVSTNLIDKLSVTIEKLHSSFEVQPVQQSFQKPSVTAKLTQSSSISQSSLISSNHEQSKSNPSVPITITGSSIVRNLEPGKLFVGDKHFDINIRAKHGASIKQLTHM